MKNIVSIDFLSHISFKENLEEFITILGGKNKVKLISGNKLKYTEDFDLDKLDIKKIDHYLNINQEFKESIGTLWKKKRFNQHIQLVSYKT